MQMGLRALKNIQWRPYPCPGQAGRVTLLKDVDLKTCLNKRGADKGQRKKRERSVLRPVHGEARIRRSSPTKVWWTEAAAAASTKQPIETRHNWRLSERGKKDLSGTNRILTPD